MTTCPTCRSTVIEVPVEIGSEPLTIIRCSHCDSHRWERNGEVVDLVTVLDLAAEERDAKARPRRT
jgi:hypothetical protein